ncbi:hypothetical protein EST38_g6420 [Candolleomyces aberdarensis]|uniref:Reverse transcriptase Ty1/copia-type domain-containing protein n=1 Tax=Candolleomyces aberdarensis TaxID=2316362 RepID=A0A4Q2DJT1_9AGAR|nr:hypothetical protein EST38_g6420 [Candolleomyces aberdarensis]
MEIIRDTAGERSFREAIGEQPVHRPAPNLQKSKGNPGPSSAARKEPSKERVPPPAPKAEREGDDSEDSGSDLSEDEIQRLLETSPDFKRIYEAELKKQKGKEQATLAELCQDGGVGLFDYLLAQAVPDVEIEKLPNNKSPRDWTFRDILRMPDSEQREWRLAMADKIDALKSREVFELVELPHGRKAIKGRWVFDIKSDGRKRARFVAKGFSQIEGIDFEALFSPVVRYESVHFVFALAALFGWYMTTVDVKTAFLYGKLDKEIYMDQPEGFVAKGQERKVYRLRKAIYGLKQAARAWWLELEKSVRKLGFIRLHSDSGIFLYRDRKGVVIMVAYVDDIIFFGLKALCDQKKKKFVTIWECRDLGTPTEFLSMTIQYTGDKIQLDQTKYLEKVLERFGMANAKPARTPMIEGYYPEKYEGPNNAVLTRKYQSVIGSLLYLMLGT